MPGLRAHVRYGDWEGTAAADNADLRSLRWYLEEQGAFDPNTEIAGPSAVRSMRAPRAKASDRKEIVLTSNPATPPRLGGG